MCAGLASHLWLLPLQDNILGNPHLGQAWLAERVESDLGKALLRRFEDSMEASRELSVGLLRQLLEVYVWGAW